jgi:hypothetical protein
MCQDVIARETAAMQTAGLDAIVSVSPENFAVQLGTTAPHENDFIPAP